MIFEPMGRRVRVDKKTSILALALRKGVGIRTECGGYFGRCGKCRILLRDQRHLNPPTRVEKQHLTEAELEKGYRLACQSVVEGDLTVFIPEESRTRRRTLLVEGFRRPVELSPALSKVHLQLPPPTLLDVRSDVERVAQALGGDTFTFDYEVVKMLPERVREKGWSFTITLLYGTKMIAVEAGDTRDHLYGVAVDLGTSKIVASLINLVSGERIASGSIENPQIVHGEDVISRITHATSRSGGLEELRSLAQEGVRAAVEEACSNGGVALEEVYEAVVVGNTAMTQLFLGINPGPLALAPYIPAANLIPDLPQRDLNMGISPGGSVHLLPTVAGFVGADDVADILATGMHLSEEVVLLIDLGTNAELNLGDREDILCCSCASGPAWEGVHIKHGVKAVEGAIEEVEIDAQTLEPRYKTVGGERPVGICGSAMIDLVAEMLKVGLLDGKGRFNLGLDNPRVRVVEGVAEFVVAWAGETEIGEDIVLTQKDVVELQLAKAAIFSGCSILMKRKGLEVRDIKRVLIAGAFGSRVDPENAKVMGLIPEVPSERIQFVGNTALTGAEMALKSREERRIAEEIAQRIRYLELSSDRDFPREFTSALFFPHTDRSLFPEVTRILPA